MRLHGRFRTLALFALLAAAGWCAAVSARQTPAPPFDPSLFGELHWRNIGPFRGGRTVAAVGIPDQPNVFYIGAVNGGVWTTNDFGRTWRPIFDDQPTGSIGAIGLAPSNPRILYVGSGEGLQRPDLSIGDGLYKSTDAGATWTHLGLRDGQQITQIVVDPTDPNRLFVAVLGHPYGPNAERGVYRSLDGGQSFTRVLGVDENTGASDLLMDPTSPNTLYAALWQARQGPWENGVFTGPATSLQKTTDGGATWQPIVNGLPTFAHDGLGRIGIGIAPSNPRRLFATVQATSHGGLYRSDDAGQSWTLVNADPRVTERGDDFAEVKVDPTNADIVYTASVTTWKSTDGGRSFAGWRGAPGGDDYHRLWINPTNPAIILLASDQGAIVTVNGGETWSSWYNQPTAQFYHVVADNAFPYRVCGGQQESGSACVSSRGDDGAITIRDWHPVAAEEYGYIAPDPTDPDVVYGGKLTRYDRRTGQAQDVMPPRDGNFRVVRTAPVLFSPIDPRTLFFASNVLWKTVNGGRAWTPISPDLSRPTWAIPPSVGVYQATTAAAPTRRGVIYTVGPSAVDGNIIWAGTDDGAIHLTRDAGRTWKDVTPTQLTAWAKVSIIEPSHFDVNMAYAAINTLRLDDNRPHLLRTKDGGATWVEITHGLPAAGAVNTIREDPVRRGLLFAGTEQAVFMSFDDGENWMPLRLNMPATSIRDLAIKDDDLLAATHGRGFWILDDITPLRAITPDVAQAPAFLFRPPVTWRIVWNHNTDTPLPPDEPMAPNPPDGVTVSYLIGPNTTGPVTLEVSDVTTGEVVRRFSSDDPPDAPVAGRNIPDYWLRPGQRLAATPGLHRFVWDLRYAPPAVPAFDYAIAAIPHDTPTSPQGMWVLPGTYQIRLTIGGRAYRQGLTVRMDPRVRTTPADLDTQFKRSKALDDSLRHAAAAVTDLKSRLAAPGTASHAAVLQSVLDELNRAIVPLPDLLTNLQSADVRPSAALDAAVTAALGHVATAMADYAAMK